MSTSGARAIEEAGGKAVGVDHDDGEEVEDGGAREVGKSERNADKTADGDGDGGRWL